MEMSHKRAHKTRREIIFIIYFFENVHKNNPIKKHKESCNFNADLNGLFK